MEMKDFAIATARKAGIFLLEHFRKDELLAGERGVAKEVTTKYDTESDALIIKEIEENFPEHNLLTEESGHIDKQHEYTWIVDSLDGSGNFANNNPFFAVSIAVAKGDELILGVVYAPFLEELFVAEKGKGAFLNDKPIHVSESTALNKTYMLACEGGDKDNVRLAQLHSAIHAGVKDFRKLGSAALEGSWVACGRAEAYFSLSIGPWDVGAAVLLVEEAGGKVTDFQGNPWQMQQMDVVMSNGKLHDQLLSMLPS